MTITERMIQPEPLVRGYPGHRYGIVEPFISANKILDVGGFRNNLLLRKIFPGVTVFTTNLPDEYHGRSGDITYDGQHMPLSSDSIPTVIAVDVLEHVRRENRSQLLHEMFRIAQDQVIISCPFYSEENERYEVDFLQRIEKYNFPPKLSILQHRKRGLPRIEELVSMARQLGAQAQLYPATPAFWDLFGLNAQVEALGRFKSWGPTIAQSISKYTEKLLNRLPRSYWHQAYRAILVIEKKAAGRIVGENELSYIDDEPLAYKVALESAGYGNIKDPIELARNCPTAGFVFGFEGAEGTGKTTIMKEVAQRLAEFGFMIALPTEVGPRNEMRLLEMRQQRLIEEPQRGRLFARTLRQSLIAGRAHVLRGPSFIALIDRTFVTLPMHCVLHCPNDDVINTIYTSQNPLPPDATFIFRVDDPQKHRQRVERKDDIILYQKPPQLDYQRKYYDMVIEKDQNPYPYTGNIHVVDNDGTTEEAVTKILAEIDRYLKIKPETTI